MTTIGGESRNLLTQEGRSCTFALSAPHERERGRMGMRMVGWSRRRSLAAAVVAVAVVAGTAAAGAFGSGAASVTVVANLGTDWSDLDVQVQAGTGNLKLPAGPYDRLLYLAN